MKTKPASNSPLKKVLAAIAGLLMILGFATPANSAAPVELPGSAWYPGYGQDESLASYVNSYRMWLLGEEAGSYSYLVSWDWSEAGGDVGLCQDGNGAGTIAATGDVGVRDHCDLESLRTDDFVVENRVLEAQLVLPPCEAAGADQGLCIEEVKIYEEGATEVVATLDTVRPQAPGPIVLPQDNIGLKAGSTMSIWNSTWTHAGGTGKYLVNASVSGTAFLEPNVETFTYSDLRISVTPVEEVDELNFGEVTLSASGPFFEEQNKFPEKCAYTAGTAGTDGRCGRNHDFSPNTVVSVSVRVPDTVGGFFKGRMESPDVSVAAVSSGTQLITAAGVAAEAPRVLASLEYCTMPDGQSYDPQKECEAPAPGGNGGTINSEIQNLPSQMQQRASMEATGGGTGTLYKDTDINSDALEFINWAKIKNNDTATAVQTLWSFSTMGSYSQLECFADTTIMHGIVTTNAMAYSDSPPELNENGELSYVVAGMHYLPDGVQKVSGSYNLLLNRSTADCLYGTLGDNPTASVQIIDDSNVEKTSTTSLTVDQNWLKLSVTGFEFSTNTINVTLQAETSSDPVTPAPVAPSVPVVTTPPPVVTPPAIPSGQTGVVLVGGVPENVTIAPATTPGSLGITGDGWSLALGTGASTPVLNSAGQLVLTPTNTPEIRAAGFQPNSQASMFLVPSGFSSASLGITSAKIRALATEPISLGSAAVDLDGTFATNLDLSDVAPGNYVLQINGAAPDGKIRSISVATNIPDMSLRGWTKKISDTQVKVYVKNVVKAGKVQIFVNGEEIAWINAGDETDRKLRFAAGFNYLVRTVNLEPGKNRIEIRLDGERIRFVTYTLK